MSAKPEAARVPTLTEVLREQVGDAPAAGAAAAHGEDGVDFDRLAEILSARIARQLEQRLDEAIAPALAEMSRTVINLVRAEIGLLLREELSAALAEQRLY